MRQIFLFLLALTIPFIGFTSEAEKWQRIYLTTPCRSGNHWMRYLVEEAAHIATGAVYRDKTPLHMDKTFPWGGYCCKHGYEGQCRYPTKSDIVLIKTHYPDCPETSFDRLPYKWAIRIVRHPVDSFYSRYVMKPDGPLLDKVPSEKVKGYIAQWRRFMLYWDKKKNVITYRYEDILENPFPILKEICQLLRYDVTDEDLHRAIEKHPPQGGMLKSIDKFRRSDLKRISEELGDILEQYQYPL